MADPEEAESAQAAPEVPANTEAPEARKKAPRPRKAKAQPRQAGRKAAAKPAAEAPAVVRSGRRAYSEKERAQKLAQIEKAIGHGENMKNAVKQAGISEQTYYHWKRAAAAAPQGGDLKDLLALEEENKRLKGLLAERLRKENAELKKKLGLA
ncbi:chemotaxis protein histidine kinase CheA [Aquamicrobium terrae]